MSPNLSNLDVERNFLQDIIPCVIFFRVGKFNIVLSGPKLSNDRP